MNMETYLIVGLVLYFILLVGTFIYGAVMATPGCVGRNGLFKAAMMTVGDDEWIIILAGGALLIIGGWVVAILGAVLYGLLLLIVRPLRKWKWEE